MNALHQCTLLGRLYYVQIDDVLQINLCTLNCALQSKISYIFHINISAFLLRCDLKVNYELQLIVTTAR